jgi:nitrate reductase NapAB chaperone NapD
MIIQSYLAFAGDSSIAELSRQLLDIDGCEVYPAENDGNVLVLVTEAADDQEQRRLEAQLEDVSGLGCLALVGGWNEQ